MRFVLVKGTKPAQSAYQPLFDLYGQRIKALTPVEVRQQKFTDVPFDERTLSKERDRCGQGTHCILLDERGKTFDTIELSNKLRRLIDDPAIKQVMVVSGGPYGFTSEAKALADETWALSKLTLQGDLAWLVALEQIYRGLTILKGIPYHHA